MVVKSTGNVSQSPHHDCVTQPSRAAQTLLSTPGYAPFSWHFANAQLKHRGCDFRILMELPVETFLPLFQGRLHGVEKVLSK